MRSLRFEPPQRVATLGASTSLHYARHWLGQIGLEAEPYSNAGDHAVVIVAGDDASEADIESTSATTTVVVWDFQTELRGTGLQASAASGVSWVLGHPDRAPLALPVDVPEKWCGLVGANLALATLLGRALSSSTSSRRYDVSAADCLRSFADQNAGDDSEAQSQWHRNGSMATEHGGIFPQGFFPCRDGHVAIIARSRKDWRAIQQAVGSPAWARAPQYEDPFELALRPAGADRLLAESLRGFDRDELLRRAIELGATIAPVYSADEVAARGVVRSDFFDEAGRATLPFRILS
jgi:crotonobetainyl-CoA:carnitine CoA-transferase CaiB-like acyl-CoA transferase